MKTAQPIPDSQMTEPNALILANQTISFHTEVSAHHANKDILPLTQEYAKRDQAPPLSTNNKLPVVSDNTESAQPNVVPAQLTLMSPMMDYHAEDANKVWLLHSTVDAHPAHMVNKPLTEETAFNNNKFKFKYMLPVDQDKEESQPLNVLTAQISPEFQMI